MMSEPSPDRSQVERAQNPTVRRFLDAVLDRRDRDGCFPKTFTWSVTAVDVGEIEQFLPRQALKVKSEGRVTVDLRRVQAILDREKEECHRPRVSVESLFDSLTGRTSRNLQREQAQWLATLQASIRAGFSRGRQRARIAGWGGQDEVLDQLERDILDEISRGAGAWCRLAGERPTSRTGEPTGQVVARETAERLSCAFALARMPRRNTLRLDLLSLDAAGNTKAFRPGTADHRRLTDALARTDPERNRTIASAANGSDAIGRRMLLESFGIVTNESPLDVLVQGPLTVQLGGHDLSDVELMAESGLPAKVTFGLLRSADAVHTKAVEVLCVENESAFHLLAQHFPDTLLVFTRGFPSTPVITLLQRLSAGAPHLHFVHTGDMDRSGLTILSTLRRLTGLVIDARWMDASMYASCIDTSLPISEDELELCRRMLASSEPPLEFGERELLAAMIERGRWIEQEALLPRVLPNLDEPGR